MEQSRLKVTADHFAILADALCAAGQSMVERLEKLESDEIPLKIIKGACTDLLIANKRSGIMSIVGESLAVIHREKVRARRLILLKCAVGTVLL